MNGKVVFHWDSYLPVNVFGNEAVGGHVRLQ